MVESSPSEIVLTNTRQNPKENTSNEKNMDKKWKDYTQIQGIAADKNDIKNRKILIIYTGGTIGMKRNSEGSQAPAKGFIKQMLQQLPEIKHPDIPLYDIQEYEKPIDSSEIIPDDWKKYAETIYANYYNYDGFVLQHGTDTIAYTASALSFMLENLNKPIVLTGSMIPLDEPASDAKRNLIISMMVAANLNIKEVMIFFNTKLIRGNRARKSDLWSISSIESPNIEPLAIMGVGIHINTKALLSPPTYEFRISTNLYKSIMVLHMTPCFCFTTLENIAVTWKQYKKEPPAIILLLYGSGNGPVSTTPLLKVVEKCIKNSCTVVVMTQCHVGTVDLLLYQAGRTLSDFGVIDGKDMTVEACITKLSYLMGRGLRGTKLKTYMENDLRGEISLRSILSYTGYALGRIGYLSKL